MVSPDKTVFPGILAVIVLKFFREWRIMFPWSLQRQRHSMPGHMLHLPEAETGGKLLHLTLSMCPSSGHISQRQWLRLVEKVVPAKL
jgi:hypothetical protein